MPPDQQPPFPDAPSSSGQTHDHQRLDAGQLAAIVASCGDAILSWDATGTIVLWNPGAERTFGIPAGRALGASTETVFPATVWEQIARAVARSPASHAEPIDLAWTRGDGGIVDLSVSVFPVRDAGGSVIGGAAAARDVSRDRAVERTLREQSAQLLALSESLPDIISVVGRDLRYRYVNWRAQEVSGHRAADMIGHTLPELGFPEPVVAILDPATRRVLETGTPARADFDYPTATGLRHFEARIVPILDAEGRVDAVLRIGRDVTRSRELEEELLQSQKLETVGRLAGGIAHEFNNALTIVQSAVSLALEALPEESEVRRLLAQVREAADRASALTRQLLSFARRQVLSPELVNVNDLVRGARRLVNRLLRDDITLDVRLAPDVGAAWVDPTQIEQVLLNLAVNARDAMPDGGTLVIETANVRLDADAVAGHAGALPGDFISIAVRDSGHGFSPAVRARLFEPFFTTRPRGRGAGLGLAACHGIVQQSGGFIGAEGAEGRGATFTIFLPRSAERTAPAAPPAAAGGAAGTEAILLVEDEPGVREIATRILSRAGYRVLSAPGGAEALRLLEAHDGAVQLLLTDVIMPGLSGPELAERVRARHDGVRVLFTSGYTEDTIGRHGVLDPGVAFLGKPYAPADLLGKVRAVLDGR